MKKYYVATFILLISKFSFAQDCDGPLTIEYGFFQQGNNNKDKPDTIRIAPENVGPLLDGRISLKSILRDYGITCYNFQKWKENHRCIWICCHDRKCVIIDLCTPETYACGPQIIDHLARLFSELRE